MGVGRQAQPQLPITVQKRARVEDDDFDNIREENDNLSDGEDEDGVSASLNDRDDSDSGEEINQFE